MHGPTRVHSVLGSPRGYRVCYVNYVTSEHLASGACKGHATRHSQRVAVQAAQPVALSVAPPPRRHQGTAGEEEQERRGDGESCTRRRPTPIGERRSQRSRRCRAESRAEDVASAPGSEATWATVMAGVMMAAVEAKAEAKAEARAERPHCKRSRDWNSVGAPRCTPTSIHSAAKAVQPRTPSHPSLKHPRRPLPSRLHGQHNGRWRAWCIRTSTRWCCRYQRRPCRRGTRTAICHC